MSATLAPTILDLTKDRFNSVAKRRRVPEDPEWEIPKRIAAVSTTMSVVVVQTNLSVFLNQPGMVSTLAIVFSAKAALDATVNCVKTFRAARQSALHIADPSEPKPTLTSAESGAKGLLAAAYVFGSFVPNALNNSDFGFAALSAAMAFKLYRHSKHPRGPGE